MNRTNVISMHYIEKVGGVNDVWRTSCYSKSVMAKNSFLWITISPTIIPLHPHRRVIHYACLGIAVILTTLHGSTYNTLSFTRKEYTPTVGFLKLLLDWHQSLVAGVIVYDAIKSFSRIVYWWVTILKLSYCSIKCSLLLHLMSNIHFI